MFKEIIFFGHCVGIFANQPLLKAKLLIKILKRWLGIEGRNLEGLNPTHPLENLRTTQEW